MLVEDALAVLLLGKAQTVGGTRWAVGLLRYKGHQPPNAQASIPSRVAHTIH